MEEHVMTEESTRELIEKVRAGDREAFDRIAERFRDRLSGFVRSNLGLSSRTQSWGSGSQG